MVNNKRKEYILKNVKDLDNYLLVERKERETEEAFYTRRMNIESKGYSEPFIDFGDIIDVVGVDYDESYTDESFDPPARNSTYYGFELEDGMESWSEEMKRDYFFGH